MKKVYSRPRSLKRNPFHYCPGCGHSVIHRVITELIDEMNLQDKAIGIPPPGCSVFAYNYFDIDMAESAHGRGTAVATGMKRAFPGAIIFSYQGDGDLAAIGTAETIHTANRGENITAIFVNNAVYGMTGGQMAPTTLLGQKTTTTPEGRNPELEGYPVHTAELSATFKGTVYSARGSLHSPVDYQRTKKYIKTAFQKQIDGKGYSFVEILCACPPNWHMSPVDCIKRIGNEVVDEFPLGEIKNVNNI